MDMKIKIIGLTVILCLTLIMAPIQVFAGDASGSVSVGLDTGIGGVVKTAPVASPSQGTYTSAQNVSLSAPGSSGIYYTLNGVTATNASSSYTSPINIAVTTTITCIAYYTDGTSYSTSYLYTINIPVSRRHQLPLPLSSAVLQTLAAASIVKVYSPQRRLAQVMIT
jgi:hypothetical protein